jgi:hypothetical protein
VKVWGISKMAAMLKQTLAVVAAALFSAALCAKDVELKDGHPDRYVVQKGDTLWDISGRFLNSPWLWPEVWQANPQIENPHLIYPGDVISLIYVDGQARLVINRSESGGITGPRMRSQPLEDSIKAVPLSQIRQYLERPRLLSKEEIESAPYVVALEDEHLLGMNTMLGYVRGLDAAPGSRYSIVRPSMVYREVPEKYVWDDRRKRVVDPWSMEDFNRRDIGRGVKYLFHDWIYEKKTELLGYEVMEIGTAEVVAGGDPASVNISYVDIEIKKGDLLLPELRQPFDLEFFPHAIDEVPENTRVLALNEALAGAGPAQVVVLNRGMLDGVDNGTVFGIYSPGRRIHDDIKAPRGDVRYTLGWGDDKVTLPEEFNGHVMVFRTFEKISYGLIMDAIRPIQLGDVARQPLDR